MTDMTDEKIKALVNKMTLEEKASLCSGKDFWHLEGFPQYDIPAIKVSDGPHGLRNQTQETDHLAINESDPAVCFPSGVGGAASFSTEYMARLGRVLGQEARAAGLSVVLEPAVNMKRSLLCGRNFEYLSEDPYLAGKLAAAYINAMQDEQVGTSIKHFAANNQEHHRMSVSANVDERTLREIYFPAFEIAVKESQPATVMCSYNRINGVFSSNNQWLLTEVLRDEWGFEGAVVTDWGAIHERAEDLEAGLDLEMPGTGGLNDQVIVQAVQGGTLAESVLDQAVARLLKLIFRYQPVKEAADSAAADSTVAVSLAEHHQLAREMAAETMVLLKNEESILPLPTTTGANGVGSEDGSASEGDATTQNSAKVALIGTFAKQPRFQGGGSSHVNPYQVDSAFTIFTEETNYQITYAEGYSLTSNDTDETLLTEARKTAQDADYAIIFVGLPDSYESESYDRTYLNLPASHDHLVEEIAAVQPNTIVVLHNGSPVVMPWLPKVKAVLEAYLGGEAAGAAVVDILCGKKNPSARLAETFPLRIEDTPAYGNFPGFGQNVTYQEGIFIGYRHYTSRKMETLFPFGFGLSYTNFAYSNLKLAKSEVSKADPTIPVTVDVTNTGTRAGYEVVQIYVAPQVFAVPRPVRELKAFRRVWLEAGETQTVTFDLDRRSFAHFDVQAQDWRVASGKYLIQVAKDASTILLEAEMTYTEELPLPALTKDTVVADLMDDKRTLAFANELAKRFDYYKYFADEDAIREAGENVEMQQAMFRDYTMRALVGFSNGAVTFDDVEKLYEELV